MGDENTGAAVVDAAQIAKDVTTAIVGQIDERVDARTAEISSNVEAQVEAQVEAKVAELSPTVERQVADALATFAATHGSGSRPNTIDPAQYNAGAAGAELDGDWSSFGEFARAVYASERLGQRDERLRVLQEGDLATGGALVPEQFRAELLMVALQTATIRPRCFAIPMGSQTLRIPRIVDTTHATNVFGGVQGYWTAEGGSITASEPTFGQVALNARKLSLYTTSGNELLNDAALALESVLLQLFGAAIAWFEEKAFIRGTGAGEPLGILNSPARVSVAAETGQAATTIVAENLDNMWSRLFPSSANRAVWMAHPDTFPELANLSRAVGTGGGPVWITNQADGPPSTIFGRPLIFNEHMSTLGTVGDIVLADWSYYLLGDRQTFSLSLSEHARFQNDETAWRGIERLDGQPWLDSAITPANGSSTLSPFVELNTRS